MQKDEVKKDIALSVGYSPSIAHNVSRQIEETEGFQNAMIKLATDSNNLVMAVLAEYKARGLEDFSNKDLNGALNAIASAWDRINKQRAPDSNSDPEKNPLRKVFMQKVENQTINNITQTPVPAEEPIDVNVESVEGIDMDF